MRNGSINKDGKLVRNPAFPVNFRSRAGMEMVQVGMLIAIAIGVGLIFKTEITEFVNGTFEGLAQF